MYTYLHVCGQLNLVFPRTGKVLKLTNATNVCTHLRSSPFKYVGSTDEGNRVHVQQGKERTIS